jgi:hypothetical protein
MELTFHKTKQKRSINKASIGNFIFLQKILMDTSIKKCAYGGESIDNYDILTPIGSLSAESCSIGLHKLKFKDVLREEVFSNNPKKKSNFVVKENRKLGCVKLIGNQLIEQKEIVASFLEFLNYYFNYCLDQSKNCSNKKLPSICWLSVCTKDSFSEKILKALFYQIEIGFCLFF